jgi:hypothetical protein
MYIDYFVFSFINIMFYFIWLNIMFCEKLLFTN